jgi:hypothetical protein
VVLWSNTGFKSSGCYLSMLAISLRPRNPEHLLPGTFLGLDYMKQEKTYKWRWEKRLQSGQSKLTPFDGRLRLFLEGKEDWLEEGLLVSVKKK